jgi:signal recognition particle GTPase
MLTSKNVASDINQEIRNSVKVQLVKQMLSFHRVKKAVRQALQKSIPSTLEPDARRADLLRSVVTKGDGALFYSGENKPYVIVVVGISDVGKSASLAIPLLLPRRPLLTLSQRITMLL